MGKRKASFMGYDAFFVSHNLSQEPHWGRRWRHFYREKILSRDRVRKNGVYYFFSALPFITPIIAVSIFFLQFNKVAQNDLSPWKGGGFGMFSTIDAPNARYLKIYLRVKGKYLPVNLGRKFAKHSRALRTEPTPQTMKKLIHQVAESSWILTNRYRRIDPNGELAPSNLRPIIQAKKKDAWNEDTQKIIDFDRLLIEVWKYQYSKKTKRLNSSLFMKSEIARP
jgi:hypothetical protein